MSPRYPLVGVLTDWFMSIFFYEILPVVLLSPLTLFREFPQTDQIGLVAFCFVESCIWMAFLLAYL